MRVSLPQIEVADPDAEWAASGAMALTGRPAGPPLLAPPGVVIGLRRLAAAVGELGAVEVDGPALLAERAAAAGFSRGGAVSCGGASRLIPVGDDWLALTLARPEDLDLLPAWLEAEVGPEELARHVRERKVEPLLERAGLLGLPVARLGESAASAVRFVPVEGVRLPARSAGDVLVVDLSTLWAGPLCTHLLQQAGARVVKVESESRPDGAREGSPAFFDLLHAGQESVVLDLRAESGRAFLRRLLERADVVVTSTRARALTQLGIEPFAVLGGGTAGVWVSITGYGVAGEGANRVAFGDDAAVAGGLVVWDGDGPCFCADAVADPAAGLVAAVGALAALRDGGRWLVDATLSGAAAFLRTGTGLDEEPSLRRPGPFDGRMRGALPVAPPRARTPAGRAPELGRDTEAVLAELARRR